MATGSETFVYIVPELAWIGWLLLTCERPGTGHNWFPCGFAQHFSTNCVVQFFYWQALKEIKRVFLNCVLTSKSLWSATKSRVFLVRLLSGYGWRRSVLGWTCYGGVEVWCPMRA